MKEDLNISETELSYCKDELEKSKLELEAIKKTFFRQLMLRDDEIKNLKNQKVHISQDVAHVPVKSPEVYKLNIFFDI